MSTTGTGSPKDEVQAPAVRAPRNTTRQREAGAASRAETSRRLLLAAADLFAERGYDKATVNEIAARAGVSVQTLYLAWESKRQLLRGYLQYALSGQVVALPDLHWAAQVSNDVAATMTGDQSGPLTQIRAAARVFRMIAERTALAWKLYRDAAAVDPHIAADWTDFAHRRRATMARGLLTTTLGSGQLRPGLDPETALDTVMVILSPESYDTLVRTLGYTLDQYEQWAANTLTIALLPDDITDTAPQQSTPTP